MSGMHRIVRKAVLALVVGAAALAGYLSVAGGGGQAVADGEPVAAVAAAEDIGWA